MATPVENNLLQILRKEQEAFQNFSTLLEKEWQALVSQSSDALVSVVNEKDIATETLGRLSADRAVLLGQLGLNVNDKESVNSWFNQLPVTSSLRQAWEKLIEIGIRVNEQNANNGKLITQRLESTQESLYVLRKAAASSSLYGPDGKIQNPFNRRSPFRN